MGTLIDTNLTVTGTFTGFELPDPLVITDLVSQGTLLVEDESTTTLSGTLSVSGASTFSNLHLTALLASGSELTIHSPLIVSGSVIASGFEFSSGGVLKGDLAAFASGQYVTLRNTGVVDATEGVLIGGDLDALGSLTTSKIDPDENPRHPVSADNLTLSSSLTCFGDMDITGDFDVTASGGALPVLETGKLVVHGNVEVTEAVRIGYLAQAETPSMPGVARVRINGTRLERAYPEVPPAPTLAGPANSSTNINPNSSVTWNAVPIANVYHLQISTTSTFTPSTIVVNDENATGTSKPVTLNYDTDYWWRMKSTNAAGTTASWSATWTFKTGPIPVPAIPTLSSPSDFASNVPVSTTFVWNSVLYAATYELQISTNSFFTDLFANITGITGPSRLVSGMTNGTRYYWHVLARNTSGASLWSFSRQFDTVPLAPPPPELSSPVNNATGVSRNPTLSWFSVLGATSYRIQVSVNSDCSSPFVNDVGFFQSKYVSGLDSTSVYYWRVSAINSGGEGSFSSIWKFTTGT